MYDLTNVASTDVELHYPVSPARLFELMSAPGAFGDYHPWVVKNEITEWRSSRACGRSSPPRSDAGSPRKPRASSADRRPRGDPLAR